jgi:hypothetical protein
MKSNPGSKTNCLSGLLPPDVYAEISENAARR